MRKITFTLLGVILTVFSLTASAKNVEVIWSEPDNYEDIRAANWSDAAFRKSLFSNIEKHFQSLAQDLPSSLQLKIKMTNINLAGDVRYDFTLHQEIRYVKSAYWPLLEFEYTVVEAGAVIRQGTARLRDMGFMSRGTRLKNRSDSFKYEKRIITEWFEKDLRTMLATYEKQQLAVMSSE